jgi:hypothetical protein
MKDQQQLRLMKDMVEQIFLDNGNKSGLGENHTTKFLQKYQLGS